MPDEFTAEQITEFKDAFTLFDKDDDGTITTVELHSVMRALGYDPTEKDIQNIIREIDANGDGKVDFPEFLQLMSQNVVSGGSAEDELLRTFKEFDKNGDGYINAAELYKIMTSWDPKVTEADVNEMIDDADIDGDHKISYEEFEKLMHNNMC